MSKKIGKVIIAGTGPGDPELITIKLLKYLTKADVVLYDRLIPKEILRFCKKNCELIYVGKEPGKHTFSQSEIIKLMIEKAKEGKLVLRLHGGDPCIFSRGFEEYIELKKHGIECEIIPGITSAFAIPIYFKIPPLHRGIASSVAIVTGMEDPSKERKFIDFKKLANTVNTIIILMGARRLKEICKELIEGGLSKDTPIAILRAYLGDEVKIITTIGEVIEKDLKIENPVVIVIGHVVNLHKEIE